MARAYWIAAVAAGLLAGCSTGGGGVTKVTDNLFGRNKPDDIPQDYFLKRAYCPPVQLRGGTAVYATYERGHDADPAYIRQQASITKTARECQTAGGGMTIKVGVAGRAIAGPKGGAGDMTLPIRVAVVHQGGDVLFSQLYKVSVSLTPPDLGTDFQRVIDPISVNVPPDARDLVVYVGFDEGKTG